MSIENMPNANVPSPSKTDAATQPTPPDFNPELGHEPKLDPAPDPKDSPDTPQDRQPDTVATPEGDGEFAPDQPIAPAPDGLQKPPSIDSSKL